MIKRIIVLLTVAAAMGATVVLTASGAVAQEVVVPRRPFKRFATLRNLKEPPLLRLQHVPTP